MPCPPYPRTPDGGGLEARAEMITTATQANGTNGATQMVYTAAPRTTVVQSARQVSGAAAAPMLPGSCRTLPTTVMQQPNGTATTVLKQVNSTAFAAAPAVVLSPGAARQRMERLSDQLEGCEEAESLRRADLAQRMGMPEESSFDEGDGLVSPPSPGAIPWPGEEPIFEEGFTPRAMLGLTNNIRKACTNFDENLGGPAVVSPGLLLSMLAKAEDMLVRKGSKALIEMQPPPGERVVIVGDLHGQLKDALWIFYRYGLPSEAGGNCFLFNGDIADRGRFAVEIYVLVIGWMLTFPGAVFINRGNHEDVLVNTSRCGGFYEECIQKYPGFGRQVFEAFGKFFAALPLAFLLGPNRAKILVVHGGLPRVPSQFISALKHMAPRGPTVPMRTTSLAEVVVKDCLWSDPKETNGQEVSTRGSSLMAFGPDVTLNFCHQELVGLIVRSHEVPPSGEGFAFMHQNRLCTVFSASNYKGIEHNSGAVLLITSADLAMGNLAKSVRPEVYYAPALSQVCETEFEPPKECLESELEPQFLPQTPSARKLREETRRISAAKVEAVTKLFIKSDDPDGELIQDEVVQIVGELVVAHKEELWHGFWEKDLGLRHATPARCGFVTFEVWKDVCHTVLGPKVCWDSVGMVLNIAEKLPPHMGAVDYNRFLHRFHINLREEGCVRATWMEAILALLVDKMLKMAVQEMLDFFDQDKNGRLSIAELAEAFRQLDVGLSSAQVRALFLTFATHCDGCHEDDIEVECFISALVVAAREQSEQHQSKHARARSAWPRWASRYLRHLGKDIWEQGKGEHQMLELFKSFDADNSGLLEPSEFVKIMSTLQAACLHPGELSLPEAALQELARLADFDSSGSVSYIEILLALQPTDTELGGHVRFDLFEQICSTVWCNKEALLRALHNLDPDKTMRVNADTLNKALHQLNTTIGGDCKSKRPLLGFQIEALVAHINLDEDGLVDYNAFLDAFQVKDVAR
mmetsp:Transcript_134662/g.430078  ORF Transcript_134662/g.430078 Transcript_134662/m.430078 type:complete len:977 (+) Transcript_134662:670-3600(+)